MIFTCLVQAHAHAHVDTRYMYPIYVCPLQVSALEVEAAQLSAKLAKKEAELEAGILASVRTTMEVRAMEGREANTEKRYQAERREATRAQMEWALDKEKELLDKAAERIQFVEKEKNVLARDLWKATSEAASWRQKASELEISLEKTMVAKREARHESDSNPHPSPYLPSSHRPPS